MYSLSYLYRGERHWAPVTMQMPLRIGKVETPGFLAGLDREFEINLDVRRAMPFDKLNELMGMEDRKHPDGRLIAHRDRDSVIDMDWEVVSNGETVAKGNTKDSRGCYWSNENMGRQIGQFRAKRGRSYQIHLTNNKIASELAPGQPTLQVRAIIPDYVSMILVDCFGVVGLVVAGTGLLILLARMVRSYCWREMN